jgi:hypothetical protein
MSYCPGCGAQVNEHAFACVSCGLELSKARGFCGNCGKPHDPLAAVCVNCGTMLRAAPATTSGDLANVNGALLAFQSQAAGNAIPESLTRRWSWGAFLLSIFWVFWNANNTIKLIAVGVFFIAFLTAGVGIGFLVQLAFTIYLGAYGNRIAARDRRFSSTGEFVAVQGAWARWGVIIWILNFAIGLLAFFAWAAIMAAFLGSSFNSNR